MNMIDEIATSEDEDFDDDEDEDEDEDLDEEEEEEDDSIYKKKRNLLLERCDAIQQDNDRLVSRILEIRHLCKLGIRERNFLINRLDRYGDNFRNVPIIVPPPGESSVDDVSSASAANSGNGTGSTNISEGKKGRKRKPKEKGKRSRPEKDPNLPKRPQNPFFQYCQENRENVTKEYSAFHNVTLSKKELTKVLATKWNEMTSTDKQIYYELYEREKIQYSEKLQRYKEETSFNKPESDAHPL